MVPGRRPVGQESLILPPYAWTCRVGQAGQEAGWLWLASRLPPTLRTIAFLRR